MNATELLTRQRRRVRALFDKAEMGDADALRELARVLVAQQAVERELFYPAVMHLAEEEVLEALDNHALARRALSRALAARLRRNSFRSRLAVLKSFVLSLHAAEEQGVFPRVEGNLPAERLERLGTDMEALFHVQLRRLWEKDYLPSRRKRRTTRLTRLARLSHRLRPVAREPQQHWSRVA
jgi:hypothetical protein